MKSWIMGLLFVCLIVVGGILFSSGFVDGNSASAEQVGEILQTNIESPNVLPNAVDPISASLSSEKMAPSDEKVSASALTCTNLNSGDFVVDLRIKNPVLETRAITIDPSGTKIDLLPNKTYRYLLHLDTEVSVINISVDDGTELQVQLPNCSTGGGSGSGVSGFSIQEQTPSGPSQPPTPPPPVPELSPLVLTLAGISGLFLLSRTRKN